MSVRKLRDLLLWRYGKGNTTDAELTNHIFVQKHLPRFGLKKKEKKRNKMGTKNITPSWNVSIKNYQK